MALDALTQIKNLLNGKGFYPLLSKTHNHGLTTAGLPALPDVDHDDLINVTTDQHHAKSHVHTGDGSGTVAHGSLSGVTGNQHHNQAHVLADATSLGADHTVSGLTTGFVLRALTATTAKFMQLVHSDLGSVGTDDHHAKSHTHNGDGSGTVPYSAVSGTPTAGPTVVVKFKTSIESVNNGGTGATLQNDNDILLAVAASERWAFDIVLDVGAAVQTTAMKVAFTVPASGTGWFTAYQADGAGSNIAPVHQVTITTSTSLFAAGTGNASVHITGEFLNSTTPGNLQLQWAQGVASATNLSVKPGSYAIFTKLN